MRLRPSCKLGKHIFQALLDGPLIGAIHGTPKRHLENFLTLEEQNNGKSLFPYQ